MNNIEWRVCPGNDNYEISNFGVVRRAVAGLQPWSLAGRVLVATPNRDGHHMVTLFNAGARARKSVHRLVCQAWHGAPPANDSLACHKDDDKDNNHESNLYWGTVKTNGADSVANGKSVRGERVNTAKLCEAQVIEIRNRAAAGETNVSLGKEFNVPDTAISMIVRGKHWKHVGGPIIATRQRGRYSAPVLLAST
jgi:hypothetical protein